MLPVARGDFVVTRDHWWWRKGWGPGTRYLTWHLTFDGAGPLHDAARRFTAAAGALAHVDVVPVPWLHLTMSGVGFAGDLPDEAIAAMTNEILSAVESLDARPLTFDGLGLYREGLSLTTDAAWLHDLKTIQVAAIGRVGGVVPEPGERFHPHVSLAYFGGAVDEPALLAAAAEVQAVTVPAPTLSLIELGRDERMYTWTTLASHRLD